MNIFVIGGLVFLIGAFAGYVWFTRNEGAKRA